ncbi:MAG: hypothetical protein IJ997_01190 [Mycoplasmataceae bacterium]|nr:hypothetical protein [Mycoplasmataceae bacterium]
MSNIYKYIRNNRYFYNKAEPDSLVVTCNDKGYKYVKPPSETNEFICFSNDGWKTQDVAEHLNISNYLTIVSAEDTYTTIIDFNTSISNYITTSSADSKYATKTTVNNNVSNLNKSLSNYITITSANSKYATQTNLNSTNTNISNLNKSLSNYITIVSAEDTYTTISDFNTSISNYITITSANSKYATQTNLNTTNTNVSNLNKSLSNYITIASADSKYATQTNLNTKIAGCFSVKDSIIPYSSGSNQLGLQVPMNTGNYTLYRDKNNELSFIPQHCTCNSFDHKDLTVTLNSDYNLNITTNNGNYVLLFGTINLYIDDISLLEPKDFSITSSNWLSVIPKIQIITSSGKVYDEYYLLQNQPIQTYKICRYFMNTDSSSIYLHCKISTDSNRPLITGGNNHIIDGNIAIYDCGYYGDN